MCNPKVGESSGSIIPNNENTTVSAKSLKNSDRLKTDNDTNSQRGNETMMDKSQKMQMTTSQTLSLLNSANQLRTENVSTLFSVGTMNNLSDSKDVDLKHSKDEISQSENNIEQQVQTPRKLSINRQPVNQQPQEDFDQKFIEIKNNIEKLPLNEQLHALDQVIENSQGVSKIAAESLRDTIQSRVDRFNLIKPDYESLPLKNQITVLDERIKNKVVDFGDKSEINEKFALEAIRKEIINNNLPKEIPVSSTRNGEMKSFIDDFKSTLQIEKVLGIAKPSRTDSIVRALEEYEKALVKHPGDAKGQLEALEKVQAKIERFIEQSGNSTKLGWVKALGEKIDSARTNLMVKSIQQNGISELSGRLDLYKNDNELNKVISEMVDRDDSSPKTGGSFGKNTWSVIKEDPEKFFAIVNNMSPEQKAVVFEHVFQNLSVNIDMKDKGTVNKYMDFLNNGIKDLDLHNDENFGFITQRMTDMTSEEPDMRAFIMNKLFEGGKINATMLRDYTANGAVATGLLQDLITQLDNPDLKEKQYFQAEVDKVMEKYPNLTREQAETEVINLVRSLTFNPEILNNPGVKEHSGFLAAVDKIMERNPNMTKEQAETEAINDVSIKRTLVFWNSVLEQGKNDPDFLEFAKMSERAFYQGSKTGLKPEGGDFTNAVTNKLDKEVFFKIQEIKIIGTQDKKFEAAEKLLSEMDLSGDQLNSKHKIFLRDFILSEVGVKSLDDRNKLFAQIQTEDPISQLKETEGGTVEKRFDYQEEYRVQKAKEKEDKAKLINEIKSFDPKTGLDNVETVEKGVDVREAYKKEKEQVTKTEENQVKLNNEITSFDPKTLKKTETVEKRHDFQTEYKEQVEKNKDLLKNTTDRTVNVVVNPITTPEGQQAEIDRGVKGLVSKYKTENGKISDLPALKIEIGELVKQGGISSDLTWALLVNDNPVRAIERSLRTSGLNLQDNEIENLARELHQVMIDNVPTLKNDKLEINGKEYNLGRQLGQGGFGTAYSLNNEFVAKVQNDQPINPNEAKEKRDEAIQELNAHKNAGNHPNVLKIVGVARTENGSLVPITEFASGGDLDNVMNKINESDVSDNEKIMVKQYILRKVMEGMDHVQVNQGMIHFDIKGGNILFDKNEMEPKIGDFGMSEVTKEIKNKIKGTPEFISPEMIRFEKVTNKTDTWSLGVLMHEMMFDKLPITIQTNNINDLLMKIGNFSNDPGNQILKVKEVDQARTEQKVKQYIQFNPAKTIDDFGGDQDKFREYTAKRSEALVNQTVYKETTVTPQNALALVINQMMHPEPDQRPTLEAVKQLSFFTDPLGTDEEAKEVLKKIMG